MTDETFDQQSDLGAPPADDETTATPADENKDKTPAAPVEAPAEGADAPNPVRDLRSSRDDTHRQLYGG